MRVYISQLQETNLNCEILILGKVVRNYFFIFRRKQASRTVERMSMKKGAFLEPNIAASTSRGWHTNQPDLDYLMYPSIWISTFASVFTLNHSLKKQSCLHNVTTCFDKHQWGIWGEMTLGTQPNFEGLFGSPTSSSSVSWMPVRLEAQSFLNMFLIPIHQIAANHTSWRGLGVVFSYVLFVYMGLATYSDHFVF